jgi:hypothetical protein
MENYLSVSSGTITLSVDNPAEINVDPEVFDALRNALGTVDGLLQSGQLHASQVGLKTIFGPTATSTGARLTASGNCKGSDRITWNWWGT